MSDSNLIQEVDGVRRLARIAKPEEIKKANLGPKMIFVLTSENGDKYSSFVHLNKVGKKVYKTFKDKVEFPEKRERQDRPRPNRPRAPIQREHLEESKTTIGDCLSKETLEKLEAMSK